VLVHFESLELAPGQLLALILSLNRPISRRHCIPFQPMSSMAP
jgi:hypothetical protein